MSENGRVDKTACVTAALWGRGVPTGSERVESSA